MSGILSDADFERHIETISNLIAAGGGHSHHLACAAIIASHAALTAKLAECEARSAQQQAMLHLTALDVAFPSFVGHKFTIPEDTEGRELAFNVICSDTFAWACSDAEGIALEKAPEILALYRAGGWVAVAQWVQEQRGGPDKSPFIKPVSDMMTETNTLRAQLAAANARVGALEGALWEIVRGEGPYSRDPLRHAENCLGAMQDIARAALTAPAEQRGEGA